MCEKLCGVEPDDVPLYQGVRPAETHIAVMKAEIVANFRCAASLAVKEGLLAIAERIRNDADIIEATEAHLIDIV